MSEIKALTFDVFGTVVDWRSGVAREAEAVMAPRGHALDWGAFADGWRARYVPAMAKVARGERPFAVLDVLHRPRTWSICWPRRKSAATPKPRSTC